jgi:hypothetical protein
MSDTEEAHQAHGILSAGSVDENMSSIEMDLSEFEEDEDMDVDLAFADPAQLSDEMRTKIKTQTLKLKKLFKKVRQQYDDVVDLSTAHAKAGKAATVEVVHTETDKQKISALNKRVRELKEKLEIAESKARSISVQR